MRIKKIILLEDFKRMNEGLQSDLKKYIKKNKEELNSLADNEEWDAIYQLLYTEFDIIPDSKDGKELRQTFDFIF
jgi:hypothetical protein